MRVIIQKIDLDTCLAVFILDVNSRDSIEVSKGNACDADISNPDVLCIEAGGSGLAHLSNFDHHDAKVYLPPACRQAFDRKGLQDIEIKRLVEYVSMLDDHVAMPPPIEFPSLSNIFSGMLFTERNPVSQMFKGMEILGFVLENGIDPFGTMPYVEEWKGYRRAKTKNRERLVRGLEKAVFYVSRSGKRIGFAESIAIGGTGFFYENGTDIAVLFNPCYGDPPVPKYTVAGKGIPVYHLVDIFNGMEKGWGGRETIIGSPRMGSKLGKETVVEVVIDNL